MPNTIDCERCGTTIDYHGNLVKCDNCGWYDWWPRGEPDDDTHPGW